MVKIITRIKNDSEVNPEFVQMISNATNQQSEVIEADRRSNHTIQLKLQSEIFGNFGYFYERKHGEFYEGLKKGIIQQNLIINRLDFIKAVCAYKGEPAAARRSSEKNLFKESKFIEILASELSTKEMFFAYYLFYNLIEKEKSFKKKNESIENYGYSLMYGKWAVIYSIKLLNLEIPNNFNELHELSIRSIEERLNGWIDFDNCIRNKESNFTYFSSKKANFELYYKVNSLDTDIREYFLK